MKVTEYSRVRISYHKTSPYTRYINGKREQVRVRTKEGIRLLKLMGECLKAGGAVQMETFYDDEEGKTERMNLRLEWP